MAAATALSDWLQQHWDSAWLVGLNSQRFWQVLDQRLAVLAQHPAAHPGVLVAEPEPLLFLAGALGAIAHGSPVVLCNPRWGDQEWQQVRAQLAADLIWGAAGQFAPSASLNSLPPGSILIPTGGSSGQIKFAIHTWHTLTAAAIGFQQHFQIDPVHAYCVLPLYHVSGFMQAVRVLLTGGTLAVQAFAALMGHGPLALPAPACLSLVPTQLRRLLDLPERVAWLRQFQVVLLGGAPAWPQLLDQARDRQIPLALTYGMTETAALVAALRPAQFLAGETGTVPMPHVAIAIGDGQEPLLPPESTGRIYIQATSVCQGYWPPQLAASGDPLATDDIGYLDARGYLHVVGRASTKIISGGENIFPAEVEAALLATGWVEEACVVGLPDLDWGQVVTAIVVTSASLPLLIEQLRPRLSRYKQPKHWIVLAAMPRNPQGKINRAGISQLAEDILNLGQSAQPGLSTLPASGQRP